MRGPTTQTHTHIATYHASHVSLVYSIYSVECARGSSLTLGLPWRPCALWRVHAHNIWKDLDGQRGRHGHDRSHTCGICSTYGAAPVGLRRANRHACASARRHLCPCAPSASFAVSTAKLARLVAERLACARAPPSCSRRASFSRRRPGGNNPVQTPPRRELASDSACQVEGPVRPPSLCWLETSPASLCPASLCVSGYFIGLVR